MSNPGVSPITICVAARDRQSCVPDTLRHLATVTDPHHPVLVVLGGTDSALRSELEAEFGARVQFVWESHPLNQSESRNIGLRTATTELIAFLDSDVRPRAGWLDALAACQADTGAAMVVPVILERDTVIHCAGNDFYIDVVDGAKMGHKTLRYFGKPFHEESNLRRCEIDYGELHCHLMLRQAAIDADAFDERIIEVGEVDSGFSLRTHGYTVWFEPTSVVLFDRFLPIHQSDIAQYESKWDPIVMLDGLKHFYEKWGVDATEDGSFAGFLSETNAYLGRLPRKVRTEWSLAASRFVRRGLSATLKAPQAARFQLHKRQYGGREWDAWIAEARSKGRAPVHPELPMLASTSEASASVGGGQRPAPQPTR
jgi:glycosyltransferase involved in cell wall biosynthesis